MPSLSVAASDEDVARDPERFLKSVLMENGKLSKEARETTSHRGARMIKICFLSCFSYLTTRGVSSCND